jgi:hypothetical protein
VVPQALLANTTTQWTFGSCSLSFKYLRTTKSLMIIYHIIRLNITTTIEAAFQSKLRIIQSKLIFWYIRPPPHPLAPIEWGAGWAPELVCKLWSRNKSNSGSSTRSPSPHRLKYPKRHHFNTTLLHSMVVICRISNCTCCSHFEHRISLKSLVSLQFLTLRHSVGLFGRVISPLQGRYLSQTQ